MYTFRHFGYIALSFATNSLKLAFWVRGAWIWLGWEVLVWSGGLVSLLVTRERGVECECCGWRGRKFFLYTCLSGMKVHRFKEEVCPSCGALKRQRQLVSHVATWLGRSAPELPRVLDIGPRRGEANWFRRQGLSDVLTVDIRPGIATSLMDITRMGFRESVFDLVLCSHVLEHVPQDLVAMREMFRVLKPGGTCLIQVPIGDGLPTTVEYGLPNREDFDHVRAYGLDFQLRLKSVGFNVLYSEGDLFELTRFP